MSDTTLTKENRLSEDERVELAKLRQQNISPGMEDWCGSETDKSSRLVFRRVYNGVMVHAYAGRDMLVSDGETLVFQDMEKLVDWIQQWHKATAVQR